MRPQENVKQLDKEHPTRSTFWDNIFHTRTDEASYVRVFLNKLGIKSCQ